MMESYEIRAYAKVNLGLDVIKRLDNGYHQVKMVMQSIGIYDELILQKTTGGIVITTDSGEIPSDESNLAFRAARLMIEKYGLTDGIRIHLKKNIPVAAGLAGGSSDAAAVFQGMNTLFGLGLDLSTLMELGVKIGADVPYCILGGTALAEGIGEVLTALPPAPDGILLVVKPEFAVSTKAVYERLDAEGIAVHPDIDGMVRAIKDNNLDGVVSRMGNVLESVTEKMHPRITEIKNLMLEMGARNSLMSGSGPTVFGVFSAQGIAWAAYEAVLEKGLAKQLFLTDFVDPKA